MQRKLVLYLVGLAPLGIGYPWLKMELPSIVLLIAVIAYLLLLRWVCEKYGK